MKSWKPLVEMKKIKNMRVRKQVKILKPLTILLYARVIKQGKRRLIQVKILKTLKTKPKVMKYNQNSRWPTRNQVRINL